MLMEVERLPGAIFITGGTTTKVGLRDILLDKKPRFLIIDELDKISNPDDVSVLLTLMESGRVIVTKHKEHREERMKTWVFAAANTTSRMPPELLDRFQRFYLRPYDDETLKRVIVKCLTTREKVDKSLAEYIADKVVAINGSVRDAIRLARLATTKEEVDKYWSIMKKYRRSTA
jgi:Holliday junction DNA helicase RuvB